MLAVGTSDCGPWDTCPGVVLLIAAAPLSSNCYCDTVTATLAMFTVTEEKQYVSSLYVVEIAHGYLI